MKELLERRQENSKTFDMGNGGRRLVAHIGMVHYKDNYADKSEQWKDIDLTWEGNKITKAPYELTREGNKLTIRNKKNGEVSTIELLGDIGLDTDIEIEAQNEQVKFTRVLKSDKAPKEARFRVIGNFRVRAKDEEGNLPVEATMKNGILTETLKPDRPVKYPVRIDPTWQVTANTDDCHRNLVTDQWSLTADEDSAGSPGIVAYNSCGCGMRFQNITIGNAATINNGTHLTMTARFNRAVTTVNTKVSAEDVDDAPTFADDKVVFDARFGNHTTARIDWLNIGGWAQDAEYNSPEIKTVIKEIVDRGGWASGQDIVIFWEDFDDNSDHNDNCWRQGYSHDTDNAKAPKLVIEFTEAAVGLENKSAGMGAKMIAGKLI